MANNRATISVIIPAINEAANIASCVRSARQFGAEEVIIVDGGSGDATRELARAAGGQVIDAPAGRARQQNAGAAIAQGDVLLFLHADCRLPSDAAAQIYDALTDASVECGAFVQKIEAEPRVYRWLEFGNSLRVKLLGWAYGDQGIFVRRRVFEEVGGFPNVALLEDLLLMRVLRRRHRPVLLPGPLQVGDRRWRQNGVIRQTLRNWTILGGWVLGISPERLSKWYRRHDQV